MTTFDRLDHEFRIPGTDGIDLIGSWIVDLDRPAEDRVIGMHLHHPYGEIHAGKWPECGGGGYIAWVEAAGCKLTGHTLCRGGPGRLDELTITPSLWHRARGASGNNSPHRGCHGYLTDGRWVVV